MQPTPAPAPLAAPDVSPAGLSAQVAVVESAVDILEESAEADADMAVEGAGLSIGSPVLLIRPDLSVAIDRFTTTTSSDATSSTAETVYRAAAATTEYDLRPLNDDLRSTDSDDLLADILAESSLVLPL
jgi:hypothetical protein